MKWYSISLVLFFIMVVCLLAGYAYGVNVVEQYYSAFEGFVTTDEAVSLLESYRYNHQNWINNSDWITESNIQLVGSLEDNQRIVDNYTKIIDLIKRLEDSK